MKKCKVCGIEKSLDNFYTYRRPGMVTYYARCKPCHREWKNSHVTTEDRRRYRRAYRQKVMDFVNEQKKKPCADCGAQYPPYVMDFDHLEEFEKFNNLAKMIGRNGFEKVQEEIAKCDLVCSNCHRARTHKRREER